MLFLHCLNPECASIEEISSTDLYINICDTCGSIAVYRTKPFVTPDGFEDETELSHGFTTTTSTTKAPAFSFREN